MKPVKAPSAGTEVSYVEADTLEHINIDRDIQADLNDFMARHMRKELKIVSIEGQFMHLRDFLVRVMPGNLEALTTLQVLENCESLAVLSVKNQTSEF